VIAGPAVGEKESSVDRGSFPWGPLAPGMRCALMASDSARPVRPTDSQLRATSQKSLFPAASGTILSSWLVCQSTQSTQEHAWHVTVLTQDGQIIAHADLRDWTEVQTCCALTRYLRSDVQILIWPPANGTREVFSWIDC
jgi:hypothetical protein